MKTVKIPRTHWFKSYTWSLIRSRDGKIQVGLGVFYIEQI